MNGTIELNGNRGCKSSDWLCFLNEIDKKVFADTKNPRSWNGAIIKKLWVVCNESITSLSQADIFLSNAQCHISILGIELKTSLAAINYLADAGGSEVILSDKIIFFNSISDFANSISSDDYVIFIGPNAKFEPTRLKMLVEKSLLKNAGFIGFDLWYEEGDISYPVLLGGIDPVAITYCDYFFSTFLIRGDVLNSVIEDTSALTSPWALVRRVLGNLQSFMTLYIPAPLVRDDSIPLKLSIEKDRLINIDFEYQKKYLELDINCEVENQNRVAAVICTKDKSHLLYQLVSSLQKNMEVDEIVIVSNNPSNVYTKKIKELILNFNKVKI